ncbi:hypothetical protein ACU686_18780 [Yinghuangia aomiensis]
MGAADKGLPLFPGKIPARCPSCRGDAAGNARTPLNRRRVPHVPTDERQPVLAPVPGVLAPEDAAALPGNTPGRPCSPPLHRRRSRHPRARHGARRTPA